MRESWFGKRCRRCIITLMCAYLMTGAMVGQSSAAEKLKFNRDIRPILSDKCFQCHGPDASKRQADLRLDDAESALEHRDGKPAILPGHADQSPLYQRLISDDADDRMPPVDTGVTMSKTEIATLKRWIEEGAEFEAHWAFLPPTAVAPPDSIAKPLTAVDAFVLDRLQKEHLSPSPTAEKTTLIRRATFDITGLPPTLGEIDNFLTDESPDAFERVLDRLFASPRYGERMAMPWMQAARYSDTNGYQTDGPRTMWRWRDWVIDAYNRNLPFDQFTIEQLAGDLLPDPSLDQLIATGFNRNHRGNAEGGIIPEEFQVEYVVDRVETTSTVWLGLTLGCCRCHNHKYDPVTQREFYSLYAMFNQVPELGKTLRNENSPPLIPAPTRDQQRKLKELTAASNQALESFREAADEIERGQTEWEAALPEEDRVDGIVSRLMEFRKTFPENPKFDGKRLEVIGNEGDLSESDAFAVSAWITVDDPRPQTILARMEPELAYRGYEILTKDGKVQVVLSGRILDDLIRVETEMAVLSEGQHHVLVTYDGTKLAPGVKIFLDGDEQKLRVVSDLLSNPFQAKNGKLQIGGGGISQPFLGEIDDVRIYRGELTPMELAALASSKTIPELVKLPKEHRSRSDVSKLSLYYLEHRAPAKLQAVYQALLLAQHAERTYIQSLPTTMIMQDQPGLRETHVLIRGEYNRPGDQVEPGAPACLPKFEGMNRLDLARWLVSPEHPLTSRITVNRLWGQVFGTGLVKTTEDFGAQGELPSHPELLDWLAVEFQRQGWDVKQIQRRMLESSTYRQSTEVSPELMAHDPDNRLLARGPRFRLSAEMIRDAALSASGFLVEELGGPSVKPYQPAGLWEELSAEVGGKYSTYVPDEGAGLYRRGLYTFWKRTVSPPMMTVLDAPTRDMCRVNVSRTNTPLQALNLMNDVTYIETARLLAERMLLEGGSTPESRIAWAFRVITAREPTSDELGVLTHGFEQRLDIYRADPELANSLLNQGAAPIRIGLDQAEMAAYATVATVLMNLDEFVTRE